MLISQHAHQRIGKPASESAQRLGGNGNRDRRLDHQIASTFASKIQHRGLTREKTGLGTGNDGGKSCAAPRFYALVREAHLVSCIAPRCAIGTVLRTASAFARPAWSAFCGRRGSGRRKSHVRKRLQQSSINGRTLS